MLACLIVCLLVCMLACLLVCMFACLLVCLFVCLFACLLACSFVCLLAIFNCHLNEVPSVSLPTEDFRETRTHRNQEMSDKSKGPDQSNGSAK